MKKIDKLVVKTFLGPFIITFFITLFVFVMQFLWKYIDDLVGKGLELPIVLELLFYASASMVPIALPLAVLLSSIMTFGNLGEHNELISMKASGISLIRIMRSLIVGVGLISIGAFLFSNYALPYANLKFGALLYDITHQKPALNIKPGVFYNGFEGISLRINKKADDNKTIEDIMIYDHSEGKGNSHVIVAESGEMYTSPDQRYLIIKLINGNQYQDIEPKNTNKKRLHSVKYYETVRISFKEWKKVFDMSGFDLSRTDEGLFKDHFQMMSLQQLKVSIDSLNDELTGGFDILQNQVEDDFYFLRDTIYHIPITDTNIIEATSILPLIGKNPEVTVIKALRTARNFKNLSTVMQNGFENKKTQLIKSKIEWHRKFTLPVACIILFFIGGPLGGIIRKGGLGLPLVVAVLFFIVFHVISIIGEKFAKEAIVTAPAGMWLPSLILFPIGVLLTYRVMYDSVLFNLDWYKRIPLRIFAKLNNR